MVMWQSRAGEGRSALGGVHRHGVAVEDAGPAAGGADALAHRLGLVAVILKAAMLELDPGQALALGDEADLNLGQEIGIELPLGTELPGEHEARRRLPDQHAAPVAFAAVLAALIPAAAGPRLHDGLLLGRFGDGMAFRPPACEAGGEDIEGPGLA